MENTQHASVPVPTARRLLARGGPVTRALGELVSRGGFGARRFAVTLLLVGIAPPVLSSVHAPPPAPPTAHDGSATRWVTASPDRAETADKRERYIWRTPSLAVDLERFTGNSARLILV